MSGDHAELLTAVLQLVHFFDPFLRLHLKQVHLLTPPLPSFRLYFCAEPAPGSAPPYNMTDFFKSGTAYHPSSPENMKALD